MRFAHDTRKLAAGEGERGTIKARKAKLTMRVRAGTWEASEAVFFSSYHFFSKLCFFGFISSSLPSPSYFPTLYGGSDGQISIIMGIGKRQACGNGSWKGKISGLEFTLRIRHVGYGAWYLGMETGWTYGMGSRRKALALLPQLFVFFNGF